MPVTIQTTEQIRCKHCGSPAIVKYGSYKGVPRYWCKSCKRKFKADDKQFKMKTSTEQVATALHDYYDGGSSVRAIGRHILQETGSTPSSATIYEWIQKYTQYIKDSIKDYRPKVGDTWIADETVLKIGGQNVWLWDIIDSDTRYLLASRLSMSRTTRDAQILMDRAIKTAGKNPKAVITDKWSSYLDVRYGGDTEHKQGSPFSTGEDSTSQIERWHGTIKARTKVMRGLKNLETAHDFVDGFLAYYNYLRPHESLDNKTPAEVAGIVYPYKNWTDIIREHKPSVKVQVLHVERDTLRLPKAQISKLPRIPSITPPAPRISKPAPTISNAIYRRGKLVSRRSMGRGTRLVTKGKRGRGMIL